MKADVISRIRPALVVLGAAGLVLVFMLMVNLASVAAIWGTRALVALAPLDLPRREAIANDALIITLVSRSK